MYTVLQYVLLQSFRPNLDSFYEMLCELDVFCFAFCSSISYQFLF